VRLVRTIFGERMLELNEYFVAVETVEVGILIP
jgi:hypothetical protein